MRYWPSAFALALAGCAPNPLGPDPLVEPLGKWSVVAIDGEPTGGGDRFRMTIEPPFGSAQFGCNKGGGPLRVEPGRLVPGEWIITVAGCPHERMQFERKGFDILAEPLAVERLPRGLRLRNKRGSIDLVRS